MKNLTLILMFALTTMSIAPAASALGGHGGSGGDGFLCEKAKDDFVYPPYDLRLVDTYGDTSLDQLVQNNVGQLMNPFGMRTVARFMNRKMPEALYPHPFKKDVKIPFGTMILLRHLQIYFFHYDLEENLPEINDDNIWFWQVPRGCKKIQLAIQDLKTSTVRMSSKTISLPVIDDLFLRLHETLISLRNQPGLDTTPVRRDVERLAVMVRDHREDFVRGLTEDYQKSLMLAFRDPVPALIVPPVLRCHLSWRMPRLDKYQPQFAMDSSFVVTRVSGSGLSTDKNVYRLQTTSGASAESYSTRMYLQPTFLSSTTASEINAFETKFELSPGVTYELGILDHYDAAGVYLGNIQATFTDEELAMKGGQKSTHEKYNTAGVTCAEEPVSNK